jgi:hypothetical protein
MTINFECQKLLWWETRDKAIVFQPSIDTSSCHAKKGCVDIIIARRMNSLAKDVLVTVIERIVGYFTITMLHSDFETVVDEVFRSIIKAQSKMVLFTAITTPAHPIA